MTIKTDIKLINKATRKKATVKVAGRSEEELSARVEKTIARWNNKGFILR